MKTKTLISNIHLICVLVFLLLGLFLFLPNAYCVDFFDGHHCPKGFYELLYPIWTSADKLTDEDGNTSVDNYGLNKFELINKFAYYGDNYVAGFTLPFGYVSNESKNKSDTGFGDMQVFYGYFLPVKWADILPVIDVKLPTGSYDSNKSVNYGSGQTDLIPEIFLNKIINKFVLDFAVRYRIKFENEHTNVKPGNQLSLEGLVTYNFYKNMWIGPKATFVRSQDNFSNGNRDADTDIKLFSAGGQFIYQFACNWQFLIEGVADIISENTTKGYTAKGRICYRF